MLPRDWLKFRRHLALEAWSRKGTRQKCASLSAKKCWPASCAFKFVKAKSRMTEDGSFKPTDRRLRQVRKSCSVSVLCVRSCARSSGVAVCSGSVSSCCAPLVSRRCIFLFYKTNFFILFMSFIFFMFSIFAFFFFFFTFLNFLFFFFFLHISFFAFYFSFFCIFTLFHFFHFFISFIVCHFAMFSFVFPVFSPFLSVCTFCSSVVRCVESDSMSAAVGACRGPVVCMYESETHE